MSRRVGCLGDIIFEVSNKTIRTFDTITRSGSARYAEHKRHLKRTLTEFLGINTEKVSFAIELMRELNVDVDRDIDRIIDHADNGTPLTLVVGTKVIGKYMWTIQNYKVRMQNYDEKGNVAGAVVSLTLLEYVSS